MNMGEGTAITGTTAYECYFKGRGLLPFLIRLLTWRWWQGQPFAEVPAHIGVLLGDDYFEAITTGVRTEKAMPATLIARGATLVPVTLPDPEAARTFWTKCVHDAYDYPAIARDLLHLSCRRGRFTHHLWDCSEVVYVGQRKGGRWLPATRTPVSPNAQWLLRPPGTIYFAAPPL